MPTDRHPFTSRFAEWLESENLRFTHKVERNYDLFTISEGPRSITVICLAIDTWKRLGSNHPLLPSPHVSEIGNRLLPIILWEDIWYSKPQIVQSRLLALLGISVRIPARKTKVARIDKPTADRFLETHHLNGSVAARYRLGLFLPAEQARELPTDTHRTYSDHVLIAVAAFAAPKTFYRDNVACKSGELVRFASYRGTTVIGGLTKLIKHFSEHYRPDDLMTYADLEWSTGISLQKAGFEIVEKTPPLTFLVHSNHFSRYPLHKLDNKIRYGSQADKLVTIHNAGNLKYIKKFIYPPAENPPKILPNTRHAAPTFPPYDIIFVTGPTASGKTSLAVRLAYEIGAEIISLDSRQVYRKMDIGSGKDLDSYKIAGVDIPYHLIDIADPGTTYTLHDFKHDFLDIYQRLKRRPTPIIACGGSGLYIEAALNVLAEQVPQANHLILSVSPAYDERKQRIKQRLITRLESGLIEEVSQLIQSGVAPEALIHYGLEYKYVTLYLQNELTYDEMVNGLLTAIYRFSKRQLTFLRKIERSGYAINWLK